MGILNITPDSFYDGSRTTTEASVLKRAETMLDEGADFLDLGAVSSKPGSTGTELAEERTRLIPMLKALVRHFPEAVVSIDTWRSEIAEESAATGASIINDISGGHLDPSIIDVAARYRMPYVLMHMQGTPKTMQENPHYEHVCLEVMESLRERIYAYRQRGVHDIIIDPGFGFGKTLKDNFRLLSGLNTFKQLDSPILAGLSRKSMIYRTLETNPEQALNGTTALNMVALVNGASILRVHDVREAKECIRLYDRLHDS
jgi:dihydropteroate synthase